MHNADNNYGGRMTIAQVQPLNTPTASELTKAHDFLHEADLLVTDVKSLLDMHHKCGRSCPRSCAGAAGLSYLWSLETVLVEVVDNLDLPRRAPGPLLMPSKLVTTPAS